MKAYYWNLVRKNSDGTTDSIGYSCDPSLEREDVLTISHLKNWITEKGGELVSCEPMPGLAYKIKTYKAKIKIVFEGTIEVGAENKILAKEYIQKHFGVTGLNCHASIDDIDWDICLTPEKHVGKICLA